MIDVLSGESCVATPIWSPWELSLSYPSQFVLATHPPMMSKELIAVSQMKYSGRFFLFGFLVEVDGLYSARHAMESASSGY